MKKKIKAPGVRVCPDSRDASKDYFISLTEAQRLLDEGKLVRDLTNSKFGEPVYCIPKGTKGE